MTKRYCLSVKRYCLLSSVDLEQKYRRKEEHSKLREKKIEKHDFEGNSPNNNYLARIKKLRRDPKSRVLL